MGARHVSSAHRPAPQARPQYAAQLRKRDEGRRSNGKRCEVAVGAESDAGRGLECVLKRCEVAASAVRVMRGAVLNAYSNAVRSQQVLRVMRGVRAPQQARWGVGGTRWGEGERSAPAGRAAGEVPLS